MQFPETEGRQALYSYVESLRTQVDTRMLQAIVERGKTWTVLNSSHPLPLGAYMGKEDKCYDNTLMCLVGDMYIGFMFLVAENKRFIATPIEHSWNVLEGSMVDTTVRASQAYGYWYIGVRISRVNFTLLRQIGATRGTGPIEAFSRLDAEQQLVVLRDISSSWSSSVLTKTARPFSVYSGLKQLTDYDTCAVARDEVVSQLSFLIGRPYANVWDCNDGKNRFAICSEVTSVVLRVLLPLNASYLGRGREEIFSRAALILYAYLYYTESNERSATSASVPATLRAPDTLNPGLIESALAAFSMALYYEQKQTDDRLLEKMTNVLASDPALQLIIYTHVTRSSLDERTVAMGVVAPLNDPKQTGVGGSVVKQALPTVFYDVIDCLAWDGVDADLIANPTQSAVQTLRSSLSVLLIFAAVDPTMSTTPPWLVASAVAILLVEMHSDVHKAVDLAQLLGVTLHNAQIMSSKSKVSLTPATVESISKNTVDIIKLSDQLTRSYYDFMQGDAYQLHFRRYLIRLSSVEDSLLPRTDRDLAALESFIISLVTKKVINS